MSAIDDLLNSANEKRSRSAIAGPAGLEPAARTQQVAQGQQGASPIDSLLNAHGGSITGQTDMTGTFRSWYTGARNDGTQSGWDTDFQRTFQSGFMRAQEENRVLDYFSRDDAVGVVTWDNAKGRGNQRFTFGDVVVAGEKVGNVYEDFDRHTANVMMGDYLIETGDKKRRLNEKGDFEKAWEEEISRRRAEETQKAEVAPRAAAFEKTVIEEAEENPDKEKIIATAVAGGTVLGAGIGSFFTPVGTAVGAVAGGLISGIGAWLNNDSLAYQLARTREQHRLASEEGAGIQSWMSMVAQNTMSMGLSPLQNLTQGTYDVLEGEGPGAGEVGGAFQATNDEGQRKAGFVWQAADFVALMGDSALQFASPAGRLAYQAQMSTQIGSGIIGLLPGQGQWDQRLVQQNSVWTRQEINPETGEVEYTFDLGNALAGIGNVGIDAVQLGGISGLSRQADRLAAEVARKTGTEPGRWAKPFAGNTIFEKMNLTKAQREALAAGGSIETRSGFKFVIDDAGKIVGRQKATLAMLAPSEGLQALTAKMIARRDNAQRLGAVTSEQLYQAATDLALGQRGLQAMLVNAVGEAQEEVAQGFLEPWSQDHSVNAEEVVRAGLAGAASGFGMTFSARLGRPSQDMQMFSISQLAHAQQTGGEVLTLEDWNKLSHLQKRVMVKSGSGLLKSLTDGAYAKIEEERTASIVGGVVEAAFAEDYYNSEDAVALKKALPATDQAAPIVMHESYTFRPEALATSHTQLLMNQQDRSRGAQSQLDKLETTIAQQRAASLSDPSNTELAQQVAALDAEAEALRKVVVESRRLEETIRLQVDAIDAAFAAGDNATAEAIIDGLNDSLEAMFDMSTDTFDLAVNGQLQTVTLTDDEVFTLSKAVSRLATRDPADSSASWQVMMPQVHKVFAFRKADGLYGVSQIILKAIRGDYDGDKMRQLQQVVQSDSDWVARRAGENILGASVQPEIGSTKFEKAITVRAMQMWDSNNSPMRDAARNIAVGIEADLKNRYHNNATGMKPIGLDVISRVTEAVNRELSSGGDVRKAVLEVMSAEAGSVLQQIGRGKFWRPGQPRLSNEMYWIANMVTRRMQEFQSYYAEHTPNKGVPTDQFTMVSPSRAAADVSSRIPLAGATPGQTMIQESPGSNAFRMFQKLHYTLWETTAKFAGFDTENNDVRYRQLVQHYEELSQAVVSQRLERLSPSDQVIGQVLEWLEAAVTDPTEMQRLGLKELGEMALAANTAVAQMEYRTDPDGRRRLAYTGKSVTLGQHLLYLSLEKFKRQNAQIWEQDTDLRATYNNLLGLTIPPTQRDTRSMPGNAEMAFVRIFDSVRLFDLAGADAVELGLNRTVGQVYRQLISLSAEERQQMKYRAREGAYREAEKGHSIPFSSGAVESRAVTSYKALVDALFSAADSSLTQTRTGKSAGELSGRFVKQSNDRGVLIQDTWSEVRRLLGMLAPSTKKLTPEQLSEIMNANRDLGNAMMKTVPRSVAPWAIKRVNDNGTVEFAKWFYEVWLQPTAAEAEMTYFRNLVLNSWYAKAESLRIDFSNNPESETERRIAFDSLDSRMHQLIFRLASRSTVGGDGYDPFSLPAFLARFNEAKSVAEFMDWVNGSSGLVPEGAPLLPWMDDVSVFDPTRAGGGWSNQLSTPALMESIRDLKSTANRLIKDIGRAKTRTDQDLATARAIQRWHLHLQDPTNQEILDKLDKHDEDTYNRFVALMKRAAERRVANGPRAMLQHTAHLVYGLYGPAHAKAQIPEQMAANAALEAMDNAVGFLTTPERLVGDLTSHDEESVARAPHMLLRGGGRLMTRYGERSEWELNSVDAMLPLLLDPRKHDLMRSVLFDSVIELDSDNAPRRKFLMGSTLDSVLTKHTMKDLFEDDGSAPGLKQAMQYLVKLEAELRPSQKHMIEQRVTELVIARTTALQQGDTSFEEIQRMTVQAYLDFAAVMQVVGRTEALPGEPDPVTLAFRYLKKEVTAQSLAEIFDVEAEVIGDDLNQLKAVIRTHELEPHIERIREITKKLLALPAQDSQQAADLREALSAEEAVFDAKTAKVDRMFDLDLQNTIVEDYAYNSKADPAWKHARQEKLMEYVYRHGELMQAAGPAIPSVQAIHNHYTELAKHRMVDPLRLPEEDWETLSSVIISVEIQNLLMVGPASKPPPPYPISADKGGKYKQRFWDFTYSYLADFLSEDDNSGIVKAARKLAVDAGMVQADFGQAEVVQVAERHLFREGSLGRLTPDVPIQSIESYEQLQGASAMPSVSMHGLLSKNWGAAILATERTSKKATADTTVELTWADLDWVNGDRFHDVTFTRDDGKTFERPLAMLNNRFVSELSFTYGSATTPVDMMRLPNVTRLFLPQMDQPGGTDFREVNLPRLAASIESTLRGMYSGISEAELNKILRNVKITMKFVNPDSQPEDTRYTNNVWYEGTVYDSAGDSHSSLLEAFFFGVGGINARGQQAALDTRKLALMGIEDYIRPGYGEVLDIEKNAGLDFSRMLADKTKILMNTPISDGEPIDITFYNAAYKLMKLMHWVDGVDRKTNEKVRWSAEQVIAWQMKTENYGKDFFSDPSSPIRDARLWVASQQVLADMMGDIGYGGVPGRFLRPGITDDLTTIDQYTGRWTDEMERKFPLEISSRSTDLLNTDVALQSYVQDLRVSTQVTPQEEARFQQRKQVMEYKLSSALQERLNQAQRPTFDPVKNRDKNYKQAVDWVVASDVRLPGLPETMRYLEREQGNVLLKTLQSLQNYMDEQHQRGADMGSSFWIFQEQGTTSVDEGRIVKGDLTGRLSIVPGEVVYFDTGSYEGMDPTEARRKAEARIDFFVNRGAALLFGSSKGSSHLNTELQHYTHTKHGYQRYENNNSILVPEEFDRPSTQNLAAARSRLVSPSGVTIERQRLSVLMGDREVEENTMLIPVRPGKHSKFDAIQVVFNLLPIDVNAEFNTAVTRDDAQAVQRYLEYLDTHNLGALREEAVGKLKGAERAAAEKSFDESWKRLLRNMSARVESNTTGPVVGEEFGTGDFIPLLNSRTGELLLYRHGYGYPKPQSYQRQLQRSGLGYEGFRGVVMYSEDMPDTATTHRGTVAGIHDSPGRGYQLELEVSVQSLGEKITFEHNGMKYMLTSSSEFVAPNIALFGDVEIDGYASRPDVLSKEAYANLVNSFQNAFTVFGIDFREDLRQFFGTDTTDDAIFLAKRISRLGEKMHVDEIYRLQALLAGNDAYYSAASGLMPQLSAVGVDVKPWAGKLQENSANAAIGRAFLMYLLSPNPDVNAVLGSSGFYVNNASLPGAQSQRMPELFTRAFDLAAPDSAIKVELSRRINDKLNKSADESWHLDVNSWELEGVTRNGRTIRGMLQFGAAYATEDNPLTNLMAQERKSKQGISRHAALMNRIGMGGITRTEDKKLQRLASYRARDLTDPEQVPSLWHDLTFIDPATYGPGARWQRLNPAELGYYSQSLRRYAQYRQRIDFDADIFDRDRREIQTAIAALRNRLGLRPDQEELIHYWIRQVLYNPAEGSDQKAFDGDRSPADVLGALIHMKENIDNGLYPVHNGAGASMFSYDDVRTLFHQYQRGDSTWAPFRREGDPSSKAGRDNFGEWISIAFGQALSNDVQFDPVARLDLSGFMNTYQVPLRNDGYMLDIAFDKDMQRRLLDPKTNELLTVTLDPVENNRLTEQVLMTTSGLEFEDLMNGTTGGSDAVSIAAAANWRQRRLTALARWRARNKVRPVKAQSTRDYVRNGIEHLNRDADMHSLQRIVIALRHGMAMLNPGLYVSMIPEQGFRMYLSEMTNAFTGESTLRSVSAVQRGIERVPGIEFTQLDKDQIDQVNKLFKSMGNDGAFTSLIIKDMMWKRPGDAPGSVVRAFERFAALGNKWQDPTWGTTQTAIARHYFEALMRAIESMPTRYAMTADSVIAHLRTDPTYFAREHKDLHLMASNAVIDFRSLKQTPYSLAMRSLYEPWATSGNGVKRFAGTLLKLQAMYATYNMNVLTTITGMQGYTDMLSVFLEGRRKPGSWLKMWWKARDGSPPNAEDVRTFDMSSTLDGVTIANAFIKGGVTQTGLFLLGMTFGGVLSGEDEEAKRRRRLAEAQNTPLIMDPRRLELDFRNKDTIFLDWVPLEWVTSFFRVQGDDDVQGARAAAQVSWILKPFLSPILGMERFFMTGDFSYVTHGFMDAVGSLPLFNKGKWDDAMRTADELAALAAEEQEAATPTSLKNTMYLLASAVGVYESMLLENMFVNSLYAGLDMYDRDPTRLVLRDSDGTPQVDIENNARPNDIAFTQFPDEEGGVGQGYMKRNPYSANLAAYTENNFTAAAMLSLITGFRNDYMRSQMPVRVREISQPELTSDEAKVAVILATLNQQAKEGALERRMSLDEVTKLLRDDIIQSGNWDAYHNLDALAMQFYQSDANPEYDPLSYIGADGQEVLTKSGHAALFKGLMNGTISLDDPEMRGIAISPEQRTQLEKEFFEDMTKEGRDIGLTQSQAESRAKRLMYGPYDDDTITGFRDVLWDERIPWSPDVKYKQLNTTYVMGPDGFPWATGYKRGGAPGMGGFWNLLGGLKRPTLASGMTDAMSEDGRMNSADELRGLNTGLRGLVPMHDSELIPTDWEQTQKIIDAIEDHEVNVGQGYEPNSNGGGRGTFYRSGYGRGYRRYGGGGGGYSRSGYSPTIYWSRQPTLPRGTNVYGNFARNLFWNNANIRRTTIRRERYQSSRGRLKQWQ